MVNQKISELPELTSSESTDLLVIVDDPAGSPVTKKITVGNLKSGGGFLESYWSNSGPDWKPRYPVTKDHHYDGDDGYVRADEDGVDFVCNVSLPHEATITNIIVYGNAGAAEETWTFRRSEIDQESGDGIATANINSADTTLVPEGSEVVDNENYRYWFVTSTLDTGDMIYGAVITYTT
ncbi:MAG: hypothetical protein ACTSPI_13815 [Candidatus Heimdallarchaeaceae archaeon]